MNWTTPSQLKDQMMRLWERGDLLRSLVTNEAIFPLRLSLRRPASNEITQHFDAVREWVATLTQLSHIRIAWREVQHRVHGMQRLPDQIWIDSLDNTLRWLNKRNDAEHFAKQIESTRAQAPALLPWLAKRPLQALALVSQWEQLLKIVCWMAAHPQPAMYLRQVDIPGVHSKFIEAHRAVLSELFDLVLPANAIQFSKTGVTQFTQRYGFADKPIRIRFRVLNPNLHLLPGPIAPDITLDAESFARLEILALRVFITENETNFLAFPATPNAGDIVIFGAGYGWNALGMARWLDQCAIHYWGDIDTHGFAILNQLREHLAHVSSFLMNRETLFAHEMHWGEESNQTVEDLPNLTAEERVLFDDLRDNRIRKNLRLEQERVAYHWILDALGRVDV